MTIFSGPSLVSKFCNNSGSLKAKVPITTLSTIFRASSIKDSERNPPAISTGTETEETIFLINSKLEPKPKVASKSTR